MIPTFMKVVKTNKKLTVCILETVEQLEGFFRDHDSDFKRFVDPNVPIALLASVDVIGLKALRKWYRKNVGGIRTKLSMLYWLRRGHPEEYAHAVIAQRQSSCSKRRHVSIAIRKAQGDQTWKKEFTMMPEYYTSRGSTPEDAIALAHERQVTFSLQKCVMRYGETEGVKVWKARQDKWLNTLASKTDAEKLDILRRKVVPMGRASRESLAVLLPLHRMLVERGVCDDGDVYYGHGDRNEWYLADSENFYLYDFCVPKLKLIVEYQGKVWHPDHRLDEAALSSWKNAQGVPATVVIESDARKREFAERHGFKVVYLWASDDVMTNMRIAFDAIIAAVEDCTLTVPMSAVGELMKGANVSIDTPEGYVNVTEFYVKHDKTLYDVVLSDGKRLRCSDDHYVRSSGGQWVSIGDLAVARDVTYTSFCVDTRNGPRAIIAVTLVGNGTVNDVLVDHPEHSYYANGIVSHNTGKTLLALAAGLEQLRGAGDPSKVKYDKLIVTRPVQPVGKDIGFLPGTLEEKMEPWIAPIRDNLNFLFDSRRSNTGRSKSRRNGAQGNAQHDDDFYLQLMQERGLIEIEAITFIRGRSIPNAFIIIDEAQNLSMHELKTIITRVGDGTKVILTGDIEQIDNVHVDVFTNGLSYAVERFKEYDITGHVTLLKGERSALATLASQIL